MPSGVIHLVPRDRGAGSGVRAVPWQIMTLLVHIQNGCGLLAGLVDELVSDVMPIRALTRDPLHSLVVQHFEIAADPHATVSGNVALEVAVGDEDAAHPSGGGVVRGPHVMRTAPCAVIGAGVRVVVSDLNPARSLTTANHHIRRIGEIPHDLLRALRVIRVLRCLRSIPRCSRDEIVGDIIVIPPESPTIVEVNGLPVRASHVNHNGSVIRHVDELEIDARVIGSV